MERKRHKLHSDLEPGTRKYYHLRIIVGQGALKSANHLFDYSIG